MPNDPNQVRGTAFEPQPHQERRGNTEGNCRAKYLDAGMERLMFPSAGTEVASKRKVQDHRHRKGQQQ